MTVIYSFFGKNTAADILDPSLAPAAGESSCQVRSPTNSSNTDLEKMLKDKGIKTVIVVRHRSATAPCSIPAAAPALRGFKVIVPVDGMSRTTLIPSKSQRLAARQRSDASARR